MKRATIVLVLSFVACDKPATTTAPTVPASSTTASATPSSEPDASSSSTPPMPTSDTKELTLADDDNGKTVSLHPGQSIKLTLKTNPTTGYDWTVLSAPPALGEAVTEIEPAHSRTEGAGTIRHWTWTPKGPLGAGEHVLELGYRRSFEKGKPPLQTFKVTFKDAS